MRTTTATADNPAVSRTHQSEPAFQAIKASYKAKVDGGRSYQDLITAVPVLAQEINSEERGAKQEDGHEKVKLSKRDGQLLGYAVGELYYDKEFGRVIELCQRVRERCAVDGKTDEALERWEKRCQERVH
jgi:hypothetical protein